MKNSGKEKSRRQKKKRHLRVGRRRPQQCARDDPGDVTRQYLEHQLEGKGGGPDAKGRGPVPWKLARPKYRKKKTGPMPVAKETYDPRENARRRGKTGTGTAKKGKVERNWGKLRPTASRLPVTGAKLGGYGAQIPKWPPAGRAVI